MLNYIISFLIITIVGYIYNKYQEKQDRLERHKYEDVVQRFLIKEKPQFTDTPILWVHIPTEVNARNWVNWGSRNTQGINQPYLFLVLSAIIKSSANAFKICFIDDATFTRILPNWTIEVDKLAKPIQDTIRKLALLKLVYYYGGFLVPHSYLPIKNIIHLYNEGLSQKDCFFMTSPRSNVNYTSKQLAPTVQFMGAKRRSDTLKQIIQDLEYEYSTNFTNENTFYNRTTELLDTYATKDEIYVFSPHRNGIVSNGNKLVTLDDLLSTSNSPYSVDNTDGILIPSQDILHRTKYNWFAYLSTNDVLSANTVLSRYLLVSLGEM